MYKLGWESDKTAHLPLGSWIKLTKTGTPGSNGPLNNAFTGPTLPTSIPTLFSSSLRRCSPIVLH
jgi:hypothetical protein